MARAVRERHVGTVEIEGLRSTMNAFNFYGKEANEELRRASMEIAEATANAAKSRAGGGVQALAATSLVAKRDRAPRIEGGGTLKVGRHNVPAGVIFFGAEFGGQGRPTTQQFPPHLGTRGYFLWPTVRARKDQDLRLLLRAMDRLGEKWGRKGV